MSIRKSYKRRVYLLYAGFLIISIISYDLAFKKTINCISEVKDKTRQISVLNDAPEKLHFFEEKVKTLNLLSASNQNESSYEAFLLSKASALARDKSLMIAELPKCDIFLKDGITLKVQKIVLKGTFINLVSFLNSLEKDKTVGNVSSVDFYPVKSLQNKKVEVNMRIYLQMILQK
jgi:hypothetical protein